MANAQLVRAKKAMDSARTQPPKDAIADLAGALEELFLSRLKIPMDYLTLLGAAAAALTSLSYIPQVRKAYPRGETKDLSLKMLSALTTGLVLWIVYGVMKGDWVIIGANVVAASLTGTVLGFKIRDMKREP